MMTMMREMREMLNQSLGYEINLLLTLLLFDILTGIVKSAVNKKLSSSIGVAGLLKHTLVGVTMVVVSLFAPLYRVEEFAKMLVLFYCLQYAISIVENWVLIGLPVPKFLYQMLDKASKKFDDK
jgi:toxin secretion/phage lysis holin